MKKPSMPYHFGDMNFRCLQEAVSLYDKETMEVVKRDFLYTDEGEQKYPKILSKDKSCVVGWKGLIRGKRWDWAMKDFLPETI